MCGVCVCVCDGGACECVHVHASHVHTCVCFMNEAQLPPITSDRVSSDIACCVCVCWEGGGGEGMQVCVHSCMSCAHMCLCFMCRFSHAAALTYTFCKLLNCGKASGLKDFLCTFKQVQDLVLHVTVL